MYDLTYAFVRSRSSALDRRQSVYRDRSTPGIFHHRERAGWCAPEFALYAATGVFFLVAIFLVNVLEFGHLSHIISTYFCLVK